MGAAIVKQGAHLRAGPFFQGDLTPEVGTDGTYPVLCGKWAGHPLLWLVDEIKGPSCVTRIPWRGGGGVGGRGVLRRAEGARLRM